MRNTRLKIAPAFVSMIYLAAAFIAAAVLPAPAIADLQWEQVTTIYAEVGGEERAVSTARQSFNLKDNLVRIDDPDQGGARFFNFQNQNAVIVNFTAKTFASIPIAGLVQMAARDREETIKELPKSKAMIPTMRGEAKEMMAARVEGQKTKYRLWSRPYKVMPTGKTEEIAGQPCMIYEGLAGDTQFQEIWVAQAMNLGPYYMNYFARGMARIDPQEYSHMSAIPGFIMKVVSHYGPVKVVTEVEHLSTSRVPVEAFILPEDLKETTNLGRPSP